MNSFRNIFRKAFAISFSSPYLILLGIVAFFGASYSFVDASLNQLFGVITAQDILSDLVSFYQGEIM
ncbi:hypothetical protein IT409_02110, partial [Candidatus Falkowbacteria bacterium]|nr:hypothetical protein [Candidatus Falkowbacteria bacterium]